MENNIVERIEEIRLSTDSSILYRQKHSIPSYIDLHPTIVWDAYYLAGYRYTITGRFKFAIQINNIPYNDDIYKVTEKSRCFGGPFRRPVERGEIPPMMIFVKNKLIAWSRMLLIRDDAVTYLLIADLDDWEAATNDLKCLMFPFNIDYSENNINASGTLARFTQDGAFNSKSADITFRPSNTTHMLMHIGAIHGSSVKDASIPIITEKQYTISRDNFVCVFKNGILTDNYTLEVSNSDKVTLTVLDATEDDGVQYIFFCPVSDTNIDYNRHVFKTVTHDGLIDKNDMLYNKLDFEFDYNTLYTDSLNKALDTIMKYDSDLMRSIYDDTSPIVSAEYTGTQFIQAAEQGLVIFNENHKKVLDNGREVLIRVHPMMFVNNLLYTNIHGMKIVNHQIRIPINGIKDSDKIELLLFKEVINNVYSYHSGVELDENNTVNYVTTDETIQELYESNYELFTRKPVDDAEVKMTSVDDFDRVQFKVNIKEMIEDKDGKINFNIEDKYTGEVPFTLVSKRQFRHFGFFAMYTTFNFQLPPDFNYCINKNQYFVFVNGRKINQDNFILVSASPKQPFDDVSIYMSFEVDRGDKVDVFYVTMGCLEFATAPRIPMSGNLYLDRTKFDYGFNKDSFLIFINGKKIYKSQLKDINTSKLHIDTDIQTLNDICVIKYRDPITELSEKFKEGESEWDKLTNDKSKEVIAKMLGFTNSSITDSEEDFNAWQITDTEINTEIARDYWLSERVYTDNTDVLYDYRDIVLVEKDFYGAQITNLRNAMVEYERTHTEHNEDVSDEDFNNTTTYQ